MDQTNTSTGSSTTGRGVMDRVRDSATAQLSTQKNRATDGLGSVAHAVRQSAQPLRENKQDMMAEYVEKAADQLERFSTQLRDRDMNELVNDAQRFARRQPALFIGAAFAAGVIGARFLKSSSEGGRAEALQRYEPPTPGGAYGSGAGAYGSTGAHGSRGAYGTTSVPPGTTGSTGGL